MKRALVVDDNQYVRETLAEMLREIGFAADEAGNGYEALDRFQAQHVDLVVIDILMPEKEGLETIADLRKLRNDACIIAISGGGSFGNISFLEYARRLGANEALQKPVTYAKLAEVVRSLNP